MPGTAFAGPSREFLSGHARRRDDDVVLGEHVMRDSLRESAAQDLLPWHDRGVVPRCHMHARHEAGRTAGSEPLVVARGGISMLVLGGCTADAVL